MIEGVILAAGLSNKEDSFEMTEEIDIKTLLALSLESMLTICSRVVVVGDVDVEMLEPALAGYKDAQLIINRNYNAGLMSAVRFGLKNTIADRIFLSPGYCPLMRTDIYRRLLDEKGPIVVPTYQGLLNYPLLLNREMVQILLENSDFISLREFIQNHGFQTVEVTHNGLLLDLDIPEDLERLHELINRNKK